MSEEAPNTLILIATVIGLLPGLYFAWMVVKGIILSLRKSKDDDL